MDRHHYIPSVYLRPWADASGKLLVRRRDKPQPFSPTVPAVGAEVGFHGEGDLARAREQMFGEMEDDWPRLRQQLTDKGRLFGGDRQKAALFMALQFARTRERVASIEFSGAFSEYLDQKGLVLDDDSAQLSKDWMRNYLRDEHLGFDPTDQEVEGAWTIATYMIREVGLPDRDEVLGLLLNSAVKMVAPLLEGHSWTVRTCEHPVLWTSDRPLMPFRPPSPRDEFEGVGLGSADEIRFPLSPRHLLVLQKAVGPETGPVPLSAAYFRKVNIDIAAQCFEFVVAVTTRSGQFKALELSRKRPSIRFGYGPGTQVNSDGTREPMGDIVHQFTPIREPRIPPYVAELTS